MIRVGRLVADPTRAAMLGAMLDGRSYTAGELARRAGVAASTASEHLGRLLDGGLVAMDAQGRHRYYRLADRKVARLLEQMTAPDLGGTAPEPRVPAALRFARSCYDHLAGEVGVALYQAFLDRRLVAERDDIPVLTGEGREAFAALGIDVEHLEASSRPSVRRCVDWSQRRFHLSGGIGAALLQRLLDTGWLARRSRPRALRLTTSGRAGLSERFGVDI